VARTGVSGGMRASGPLARPRCRQIHLRRLTAKLDSLSEVPRYKPHCQSPSWCYPSSVGLGLPCEVDATLLVRRKGEISRRRFDDPNDAVATGHTAPFWGDKAKPSAFSFVGGFAV